MTRSFARSIRRGLAGHFWTIVRDLQHRVWPVTLSEGVPCSFAVDDPQRPGLALRGVLHDPDGSETLVVIVHGLGGSAASPYCIRAAVAAGERQWACLRVNLRGADGRGDDIYHAGLTSDLATVLSDPRLARFERIFIAGYSLGGHMVLRYAPHADPRVRALAAVCAPLDLELSSRAFDEPISFPYRYVVLASLKRAYRAIARQRPVPTPVERVQRVRTIREWDALTVVPRFGFGSVENYYAQASAAAILPEISRPTLYVGARHDPMVPLHTVTDALARASSMMTVQVLEYGGHVGFPSLLQLEDEQGALEQHLMRWFARTTASPCAGATA